MTPLELRVTAARRMLSVKWQDGNTSLIPAAQLRSHSRAALHVRATVDGRGKTADDVTLTGAEAIGSYAVRLIFSDGHDRGIYPWTYLREIADLKA
jgi:DUF971 family protein